MKYNHVDAAMRPVPQPARNFDGSLLQTKGGNTLAQIDDLKAALASARDALVVARDELAIWSETSPEDEATAAALDEVNEAIAEADKHIS